MRAVHRAPRLAPRPRGATLEAEFRLEINRGDKQWFFLCLLDGDPPPEADDGFEISDLAERQRSCFRYPAGSQSSLASDRGYFYADRRFSPLNVEIPGPLPTDDWTHAALQMRVDGRLSLYLNHIYVATHPLRLYNADDTRWRVLLLGSSWETDALARSVTLWEGERYDYEG